MDKISSLIKEAKPLYFKEKAKRRNAKIALSILFTIFLFGASTLSAININTQNMIAQYSISPIEEMGLPIDEYGFLKVE